MANEYSFMRFGEKKQKITICLERKVRKHGYAGFVSSKLLKEAIVLIVNNDLLEELCIRSGYITAQENGSNPRVILSSDTFNGIKRGDISDRFLLFHEIGHYCCGHLDSPPAVEHEYYKRVKLLKNNIVLEDELEADRFAAEYLGALYSRWALQEALEQRQTWGMYSGDFSNTENELALREYQLRIDAMCVHFGLHEDEKEEQ